MDYLQLLVPRKSEDNKTSSACFCIVSCTRDYHLVDNILEALKLQTEAPEEIIIVSSGIKTEDVKTVEHITICNKNVPVIHINSEKLFFAGRARNLCAEHSSCEILIYIDGDDIPHPQKIEITKAVFCEKNVPVVLGWEESAEIEMVVHSFTAKSNDFKEYSTLHHSQLYRISCLKDNTWLHAGNNPIGHGPIAIKRALVTSKPGGVMWNPDLERAQDTDFCRRVFTEGYNIVHVNLPLIYYSNGGYIFR